MCTHISAQDGRIASKGYALFSKDGSFQPYEFTRHALGVHDILIRTLYCGICHSDIHQMHSDWKEETYPIVPDCMVNSCRHCEYCVEGEEQYCLDGRVLTYANKDIYHDGEMTQGGYSTNMVVDEAFALCVPKDAPLEKVGPLMCAGITTWSPIMKAGIQAGDKVGVAGFGGLGHMAVQFLVSMGANVTVFDITDEKRNDALRLGAKRYVNVNNPAELQGLDNTMRFIISTIPAKYNPMMYVNILKVGGTLAVVGMPAASETPQISITSLRGRYLTTSVIGGIRETQEMLNYSLAHKIYPETVTIPAEASVIDEAYRNVIDGKVKFRYVIDLHSFK